MLAAFGEAWRDATEAGRDIETLPELRLLDAAEGEALSDLALKSFHALTQ